LSHRQESRETVDAPGRSGDEQPFAIARDVGKSRITIRLDRDVLAWFRRQADVQGGGNYQSLINAALREYVAAREESLEGTLRSVIREELARYGRQFWVARAVKLGEEPGEDLSLWTTPAQRLEMMWTLALEAWSLTGRRLPEYERRDVPVCVRWPGLEQGAGS
jgi:uncharacterized protein (DUF4415 family)